MARKRKGTPIHGWVVLDKPEGMTSTQALSKVRRLLNAEKAGHGGTLDPLATGILPIALGEATKAVAAVQDGTKRYSFTIRWGVETTTDDAEGEIASASDHRPSESEVRAELPRFVGEIMQTPPNFSAIKVDGERAYDLARAGEAVTLAARPVVIEELELVAHGPQESRFDMRCEKGTYVRALARDLARALGTRGHVSALRRTQVGPFSERDAVGLAALEAAQPREDFLLPISSGLAEWPELRVDAGQASAIRNGNAVLLTGTRAPVMLEVAWASSAGVPIAIGQVKAGRFQPQRVFV